MPGPVSATLISTTLRPLVVTVSPRLGWVCMADPVAQQVEQHLLHLNLVDHGMRFGRVHLHIALLHEIADTLNNLRRALGLFSHPLQAVRTPS